MLILTRNIRQSVIIGEEVEIYIRGVKGDQVRLGIKAPPEIPVHRVEIYDRIKKEKLIKQNPELKENYLVLSEIMAHRITKALSRDNSSLVENYRFARDCLNRLIEQEESRFSVENS